MFAPYFLERSKCIGEKGRAYSTGAGFVRVCSALDGLGISLLNGLLERCKSSGAILHERFEQRTDHLLDPSFAEVSPEALQINVGVHYQGSC